MLWRDEEDGVDRCDGIFESFGDRWIVGIIIVAVERTH